MRRITKRSAAVIGATVLTIGSSAAWAAWGVIGAGSATVVAGKSADLTLESVVLDPQLAPGVAADIKFTVKNPNAFPVKIQSILVDKVSTDSKTCPATNVVPQPKAPLPAEAGALDVGAGGSKVIIYKGAIRMVSTAPTECQGTKFSVSLKLTGVSNATNPA